MASTSASGMFLPPNKLPVMLKLQEVKNIKPEEDPPTQGKVLPNFGPFEPLHKWDLTWKKNYFALTESIYDPRGNRFTCKECGDLFPTRLSILTHSKIHLKAFCVICMEYKATKSEMEFHMFHDHREYTYYKNLQSVDADGEDPSNTISSSELYVTNKLRKVYSTNKNRAKKAAPAPPVKPPPEHVTKVVTSRFGRCITVKLPDF